MKKNVYEYIAKKSEESILEWKICKWCNEEFSIYSGDKVMLDQLSPMVAGEKQFFELPCLCPDCRQRKRLMFRNERKIYKRKCDLCNKSMISIYPSEYTGTVYCNDCYWGDKWKVEDYGIDFDESKDFLEEFENLLNRVPKQNLSISQSQNSEFNHDITNCKNAYLCFGLVEGEDDEYVSISGKTNNSCDVWWSYMIDKSYEIVNGFMLFNCVYSYNCGESSNLYFCDLCNNCESCVFCFGLNHKKYHIYNKPCTKEQFEETVKKLKNLSYSDFQNTLKSFLEFTKKNSQRTYSAFNAQNCIGDYTFNVSNAFMSYCISGGENFRYAYEGGRTKDIMDCYAAYDGEGNIYQSEAIYRCSQIKCSATIQDGSNYMYSIDCIGGGNNFGSSGLKNKFNFILNKEYNRPEFDNIVKIIIKQLKMKNVWGDFFDPRLSQFPYNDTPAFDEYPVHKAIYLEGNKIIKQEVLDSNGKGVLYVLESDKFISKAFLDFGGEEKISIKWRTREIEVNIPKNIEFVDSKDLSGKIEEIDNEILKKAVICEDTKRFFRVVAQELDFYRKNHIPLPRKHPDTRHLERLKQRHNRSFELINCAGCRRETLTTHRNIEELNLVCIDCYNKEKYG